MYTKITKNEIYYTKLYNLHNIVLTPKTYTYYTLHTTHYIHLPILLSDNQYYPIMNAKERRPKKRENVQIYDKSRRMRMSFEPDEYMFDTLEARAYLYFPNNSQYEYARYVVDLALHKLTLSIKFAGREDTIFYVCQYLALREELRELEHDIHRQTQKMKQIRKAKKTAKGAKLTE